MKGWSLRAGGKLRRFGQKNRVRPLLKKSFSAEIYGTVGDKVIEAMNLKGFPYKIFKKN